MLNHPGIRLFIWLMAIVFFFIATGLVGSYLAPTPAHAQAERWMSAMMGAMDQSMMGYAEALGRDRLLLPIVTVSTKLTILAIPLGGLLGLAIGIRGGGQSKRK